MKKEIADLVAEIADVSISRLINSTVLDGLPSVGAVVKFLTATGSMRDAFYLAKLARFVCNLDVVPEPKRREFLAFLKVDAGEKQRVGRNLLLLLEQLSELEKADLMAMVFVAYLDGKIDSQTLRRFWDAISLGFLDDLLVLVGDQSAPGNSHLANLVRTGLTEVQFGVAQPRSGLSSAPPSSPLGLGTGGLKKTGGTGSYQIPRVTSFGKQFIDAILHGRSITSQGE